MTTKTMKARADVWKWVLSNQDSVRRASRSLWYPALGIEEADLYQAILLDLHERADSFDRKRGPVGAFIWWRAKAVRLRYQRKNTREIPTDDSIMVQESDCESWVHKVDRQMLLDDVLRDATPEQRAAAESVIQGLNGEEVRDTLNVSLTARNARLYRLGSRFR